MSAKSLKFSVHQPQHGSKSEWKPSFNGQYFQTSRISDIWFNQNARYEQNLIFQ